MFELGEGGRITGAKQDGGRTVGKRKQTSQAI